MRAARSAPFTRVPTTPSRPRCRHSKVTRYTRYNRIKRAAASVKESCCSLTAETCAQSERRHRDERIDVPLEAPFYRFPPPHCRPARSPAHPSHSLSPATSNSQISSSPSTKIGGSRMRKRPFRIMQLGRTIQCDLNTRELHPTDLTPLGRWPQIKAQKQDHIPLRIALNERLLQLVVAFSYELSGGLYCLFSNDNTYELDQQKLVNNCRDKLRTTNRLQLQSHSPFSIEGRPSTPTFCPRQKTARASVRPLSDISRKSTKATASTYTHPLLDSDDIYKSRCCRRGNYLSAYLFCVPPTA